VPVADTAAQVLGLPPLPGSASRARAFVREALGRWSLGHLADDASVVVSELATNVMLHARTDFVVTVERSGRGVRVSVHDGDRSPVLLPVSVTHPPASLLEDDGDLDALEQLLSVSATTGRGLRLLGALASSWGVDHADDGKTVWALLGDGAPEPAAHVEGWAPPAAPAPEGRTVSLVALPVRLALESDLNLDALVREFQVMEGSGTAPEAGALVTAAREVLATYAPSALRDAASRTTPLRAATARRRRGRRARAGPGGAARARRPAGGRRRALPQRPAAGLARGPELQAFRRWYADEVSRQVDGAPPRPCPFPVVPLPADRQDGPVVLGPAEQDRLAALARAVAAAPTAEEAARLVLGACVDALGVSRASVCLLDPPGGQLRIVASHGYPEVVTRHWGSFPVTADLPASEAVRTGRPVVLRTLAEREERYPALSATPVLQSPSLACVPLLPGEPPAAGVLNLSFERSRDFSARDLQLLAELARTATPALLRDA
jgi:hypothetical protein